MIPLLCVHFKDTLGLTSDIDVLLLERLQTSLDHRYIYSSFDNKSSIYLTIHVINIFVSNMSVYMSVSFTKRKIKSLKYVVFL